MATKQKLILDLDTGIDDAMAIAYALAAPNVELIGIVSSYGNIYVEDAAQNSLKILELLGHPEVPVFIGLPHSSTTTEFKRMPVSAHIHGDNGIGEVELPKPNRQPEAKSAVDFLIDAAREYKSDLTIVPTGPLTNLAAALKKDPEIASLIGNVTLMGGALTVPGNVTPVAEANILQDPEAANEVFNNPLHDTMVGLDVTLRTLLTKKETKKWRDLGTTAGAKFADIVDYYIDIYDELYPDLGGCSLHDPLAVGIANDPSLATTLAIDMNVDCSKEFYGRTIGDSNKLDDKHPSAEACINVEDERFLADFMKYLTNLFAKN